MGAPAVRIPGQGRASHHQRSTGNIAGGVRHLGEAAGDDRVGIETYPSPSIGTDRKSNLSPCFREDFASLSIANNRGPAETSDGHTGFWCIKGITWYSCPLLRGHAHDQAHRTRHDLSVSSLFSGNHRTLRRAIKQRCASMLRFKSFRSAAVTLAGVELAHRIRKGQHLLPIKLEGRSPSLREMWECALNPASKPALPDGRCFPPMHQISRRTKRGSPEEFLKSEF